MKLRLRYPLLTLLGGMAMVANAQVNAEQVMNIGRNVLGMEDYMLAIQYFNQAIKAKPYLPDPYFYRALAKLNLDDYKGAEDDCSKAISLNKFKSEAYKLRGFARQNLDKDSLAVIDYNVGLEYNPTDRQFLFYKGVAETRLKRYDEAASTFSSLLRQYPSFEEGYAARGRLNLERGDTVAALADIDKSLSLSRTQLNARLTRAQINADRKDWEAAAADMDEAIRMRPDEADFYVNRAYLRYNSDDFYGAMSDYNYALQIDPENLAALFNRALLRYEVKDLVHAEKDFTEVLSRDPSNFHALYNRGLINLEAGNNRRALADFKTISERYPRFYPVYYAMAQAQRELGDMASAMRNVAKADEMVRRYVANPERNPLDRPTISSGKTGAYGSEAHEGESETEVMERFNRLVTVADVGDTQLSYNEKIKGRVQDRNVIIEPEPIYALTYLTPHKSLRSLSNFFRELDDFNNSRFTNFTLYLAPEFVGSSDNQLVSGLFELDSQLKSKEEKAGLTPAEYAVRGIILSTLRNYSESIEEFDKAIEKVPDFTLAYMGRGFSRYFKALSLLKAQDEEKVTAAERKNADNGADMLSRRIAMQMVNQALADYDQALAYNPRLVYAWFNKGVIYYGMCDYAMASECFSKAIALDGELGPAYFNRGLCELQSGNKQDAFVDLSKAGELGVLPSYNIIKRMK